MLRFLTLRIIFSIILGRRRPKTPFYEIPYFRVKNFMIEKLELQISD